jgi:dTDP-glucose 4,6-dehydratase
LTPKPCNGVLRTHYGAAAGSRTAVARIRLAKAKNDFSAPFSVELFPATCYFSPTHLSRKDRRRGDSTHSRRGSSSVNDYETTKRILVTGGAGTIGKGLVEQLRLRGFEVVSCDRAHSGNEKSFSIRGDVKHPTYARCNVSDYREIERIFTTFGPFDYVYHCAAEFGRWNGEDFYESLWKTNAIGTKHVIRMQERYGFKLIHFSSSEVYGDWPDVMVETVMDDHEVKQLNDYALTKWINEIQIRNSGLQYGTESVIVRLFNTFGPGEYYSPYRSVHCRFLYCGLHGIPWTVNRGHTRTATFLPDVFRTLANICEHFLPGEAYNIGGSESHSIEELSNVVLKVTGADSHLVAYRDSEDLTTKDKIVDTSKALFHLKHTDSVSLLEGMRITADWMRKVYDCDNRDTNGSMERRAA